MCTFAGLKEFQSVFLWAVIQKCTVQGHFTAANEHALTLPDISSFTLSVFGGHFKIVNISYIKERRSQA
jgi:hypothetical protein